VRDEHAGEIGRNLLERLDDPFSGALDRRRRRPHAFASAKAHATAFHERVGESFAEVGCARDPLYRLNTIKHLINDEAFLARMAIEVQRGKRMAVQNASRLVRQLGRESPVPRAYRERERCQAPS
jgi:hypothetical protein